MRLIFTNGNLTPEEQKARDTMVYLFNPVLKFLLMTEGQAEFQRFGCNSCRQTAIFGADYLSKLLPDYTFSAYEGSFIEVVNGEITPYAHAYIIGAYQDRYILVDLARTTKPLIFMEIDSIDAYPRIGEYKDAHKLGHNRINLVSALETKDPEYLTNMIPKDVVTMIDNLIKSLSKEPAVKRLEFCDMVYKETTSLRR